jgi:HlyD family secretion protein
MRRATWGALLVIAIVGGSAGVYYATRGNSREPQISRSPVTRGDIVDSVGATGALQAVTTVQVGSQVSGNISELYADFNSIVRKGQVVARLDTSLFETQIEQARANLTRAEADVERLRVALDDAGVKRDRARELANRKLIPQSELDTAEVTYRSAEAQVRSAQAQVTQSRAALNQNQVNLQHTVIRAPIDGIVISRNVDVGQTVAASMQAPTLFVIAADLTRMQVIASIDEADVGRIRPAQQVRFRVDAHPTREFLGSVTQVRLQPVVSQNVVTYQTVIDVPNPELLLKPGMTANVTIEVARRQDVVRVPNAALRFRPTNEILSALSQPAPGADRPEPATSDAGAGNEGPTPARGAGQSEARNGGARSPSGGTREELAERLASMTPEQRARVRARMAERGVTPPAATPSSPDTATRPVPGDAKTIDSLFGPLPPTETRGRVWLFAAGQLKPVNVRLGISDGSYTELLSSELQPGAEVVTAVTVANGTAPETTTGRSPLMGPDRRRPSGGR